MPALSENSERTTASRIVVLGASAGGLEGLLEITKRLPKDFPAAMLVVMHTSSNSPALLPKILSNAGPLPALYPKGGEPIEAGRIYVAPPDYHMLVESDTIRIAHGPKENGFRPAVDPLFRTAARYYGPAAIGVLLSGGLDDGSYGMAVIKRYGGIAIVQDFEEALVPSMPMRACQTVEVDYILRSAEIGPLLDQLVRNKIQSSTKWKTVSHFDDEFDPDIADRGAAALENDTYKSPPTSLTCPECGGALWEMGGNEVLRYRCHVGHGFTADTLVAEQARSLEAALWTALRALEENAALNRRMAERMVQANLPSLLANYQQRAELAEQRAALIRKVLVAGNSPQSGLSHEGIPASDTIANAHPRQSERSRKSH